MPLNRHSRFLRPPRPVQPLALILFGLLLCAPVRAQEPDVSKKLEGFDAYMDQLLKDWNTPGIGVGIVINDKLVFAKGYGYRDYSRKLPFTPTTLCPIASNSKLFTAVAAGMLVEQGKLTWDKPVRDAVPTIQFYNDQLNNNVTLRDMLSHRTGVTRHDLIWFKSPFTRQELFEKLKYLEPQQPMRETFLYNNLMFSAVGYISLPRKARLFRALPDSLLRRHRGRRSRRRDHFQHQRTLSLARCPDERRQLQRQTGPAAQCAESHHATGHWPSERPRRSARLLGSAQPRLRHGSPDRVLPRAAHDLSRRRFARIPFPGLVPTEPKDRRHRAGDWRPRRSLV
jgi:hypothetical protein